MHCKYAYIFSMFKFFKLQPPGTTFTIHDLQQTVYVQQETEMHLCCFLDVMEAAI